MTGVQVQGPTEELCKSFRMADKGPVISIKLSPKQNVLALQRNNSQLVIQINGRIYASSEF